MPPTSHTAGSHQSARPSHRRGGARGRAGFRACEPARDHVGRRRRGRNPGSAARGPAGPLQRRHRRKWGASRRGARTRRARRPLTKVRLRTSRRARGSGEVRSGSRRRRLRRPGERTEAAPEAAAEPMPRDGGRSRRDESGARGMSPGPP
ncbi:gem-associated protein 7 isoform X1 [Equus przewalskii]|uniref:Gem-associated protein 7 isoform X1 n=1 Tax=Equus przewalskii TaxID=9798 RepID=A0ABM4QHW7_EQUPR|nr:gem-associated protein 7 isoform X1 [Equus caballus]